MASSGEAYASERREASLKYVARTSRCSRGETIGEATGSAWPDVLGDVEGRHREQLQRGSAGPEVPGLQAGRRGRLPPALKPPTLTRLRLRTQGRRVLGDPGQHVVRLLLGDGVAHLRGHVVVDVDHDRTALGGDDPGEEVVHPRVPHHERAPVQVHVGRRGSHPRGGGVDLAADHPVPGRNLQVDRFGRSVPEKRSASPYRTDAAGALQQPSAQVGPDPHGTVSARW